MRLGDKVVCVDAGIRVVGAAPPGRYLRVGEIYTVLGLRPCQCGMQLIDVGFCPDGGWVACLCGSHWRDSRYWFCADRFAPIEGNSNRSFEEVARRLAMAVPANHN